MSRPVLVLVGELNPHGSEFPPLYCFPKNSAGERLQRVVLGMRRGDYLRLHRYNLCAGRWDARSARARAEVLRLQHHDDVLVLLGRKVQRAFGVGPATPQFTGAADLALGHRMRYALLPHPSGRCRAWNDPAAVGRARALLLSLAPNALIGVLP